jgi:hypothetical protein
MWIVACATLCRTFRDNFYIMIFGLKFPLLLINFTGTLGYSIVLPIPSIFNYRIWWKSYCNWVAYRI